MNGSGEVWGVIPSVFSICNLEFCLIKLYLKFINASKGRRVGFNDNSPKPEYSEAVFFQDTKNIGKIEMDRKYFLSMQVLFKKCCWTTMMLQ